MACPEPRTLNSRPLIAGNNQYGKLGDGTKVSKVGPPKDMLAVDFGTAPTKVVDFCLGAYHTCALVQVAKTTKLKCWGTQSPSLPTPPKKTKDCQDLAGVQLASVAGLAMAWGPQLWKLNPRPVIPGRNNQDQLGLLSTSPHDGPPDNDDYVVDVGTGRTVVSVHCQDETTCARLDDSAILCWGVSQHPRPVPS